MATKKKSSLRRRLGVGELLEEAPIKLDAPPRPRKKAFYSIVVRNVPDGPLLYVSHCMHSVGTYGINKLELTDWSSRAVKYEVAPTRLLDHLRDMGLNADIV